MSKLHSAISNVEKVQLGLSNRQLFMTPGYENMMFCLLNSQHKNGMWIYFATRNQNAKLICFIFVQTNSGLFSVNFALPPILTFGNVFGNTFGFLSKNS